MRKIRLLVIGVLCFIVCPALVVRSFTELPALEQLQKVSGNVQLDIETTRGATRYPLFILDQSPTRFKYLVWFPKSDSISTLVRSGEQATIWTDQGKNDWVWQVEQDGKLIVEYSEIRDAVSANKRVDLFLGGGVFLVGIFALVMLYRQHNSDRQHLENVTD